MYVYYHNRQILICRIQINHPIIKIVLFKTAPQQTQLWKHLLKKVIVTLQTLQLKRIRKF